MAGISNIYNERLDDVPVIVGVAQRLGLARAVNRHLGTHGLQKGLNNWQSIIGWLAYILSQADHRKSAVQEWSQSLACSLGKLLGQPLQAGEFGDDRLSRVLMRMSKDSSWETLEAALWQATVVVHQIQVTGVRVDSTTSYEFHQPTQV